MTARIFIIEDEPIVARNIANLLKTEGFEIAGVATNCNKAKEMISSNQPDLVICNLYLRFSERGSNLIKAIRMIGNIPFLFLSSFSHDIRLNKILQTKSEMYLSAPFSNEQLISAVKKLLGNIANNKKSSSSALLSI